MGSLPESSRGPRLPRGKIVAGGSWPGLPMWSAIRLRTWTPRSNASGRCHSRLKCGMGNPREQKVRRLRGTKRNTLTTGGTVGATAAAAVPPG